MTDNTATVKNRRKFLKDITALAAAIAVVRPFTAKLNASHQPVQGMTIQGQDDDPIRADENGVFVITRGEHKPEEIAAAISEIPPVRYQPPSDRWLNLPLTYTELAKEGGELRIVMLGDSIVNDTYRSQWYDLLKVRYPGCKIKAVAVVRGSTGCWWYREEGRVKKYVLPQEPNLLIIGGISQGDDMEPFRDVIHQVRVPKPCDVLLMSGAFGDTDPNDEQQWTYDIPVIPGNYRRNLLELAAETHSAFLDMTAHWGLYMRESGKPLDWFKRDPIHANVRGEQVIGHILAAHLSPPLPAGVF
jgi:hypothetical protein